MFRVLRLCVIPEVPFDKLEVEKFDFNLKLDAAWIPTLPFPIPIAKSKSTATLLSILDIPTSKLSSETRNPPTFF